ncbi:MAG: low molecular weight phosphatase family protein [Geminicoccaceae bacterium]
MCGGNTCRSPMAAAIASSVWGGAVHAESAGVAAHGSGAAKSAIQVIGDEFGIDLTGHVPRDVEDIDLSGYDAIIALDEAVASDLRTRFAVDDQRLAVWRVPDPYGKPTEAYHHTAQEIQRFLVGSRSRLLGR